MIKHIQIKNFKAHSDTSMELSNLNILTGMNGVGKSSIIQAILLLRQSYSSSVLERGLNLNGDLCSLGSVQDCIYEDATTDNIDFIIETTAKIYDWSFKAELKNLADTFMRSDKENDYSVKNEAVIFSDNFQYISAFRNGPVNNYDKDTYFVEVLNQISRKEGRAELVAHFLYENEDNLIHKSVIKNEELDRTLLTQVEAWMREISANINIHIKPNDTSFKINYSYSKGEGKPRTNEFKATNIGFGVSYALPIVVAILQACSFPKNKSTLTPRKNTFIIIENPEAHIHPAGQAKLMELICKAAQYGVQFIIETHSDHIINGLLVGVKKEILSTENAKVYYFGRNKQTHSAETYSLPVLKGGKIKKAPKGFFDQMDIDMSTLMGF